MKFTKMHGTGNDFVCVNCLDKTVEDPQELAVRLSDRHFGVGGDGLILVCPSERADFRMRMFNPLDGSEAHCGNGLRCFGKLVYDKGLTAKRELTIETLAGIKQLSLNVENGAVASVTVDMGEPELRPKYIPLYADGERFVNEPVYVGGTEYRVTAVSMGNPHAVVFVDDADSLDLPVLGPGFENHSLFPERTNTEFVRALDRKTLKMRVWERGAGETLACGTGACACLVAAVLNDKSERSAKVLLLGGGLDIEWSAADNRVYMTGPAAAVFEGETLG